jgi:hypothetical protein
MRDIPKVVFVVAVMCACSSSRAPAGDVQITTSLAASRQLSTLSNAEAESYCGDVNAYLQSQLPASQRQSGACAAGAEVSAEAASGDRQSACQTSYDTCLQSPVPASTIDCNAFALQIKACPATVNDYGKCIVAETGVTAQLALQGRQICNMLPEGGMPALVGSLPADCLALPAGCVSSNASGATGTSHGDAG